MLEFIMLFLVESHVWVWSYCFRQKSRLTWRRDAGLSVTLMSVTIRTELDAGVVKPQSGCSDLKTSG